VVASGLAEVLEHFGLFLTVMHRQAFAIHEIRGRGKDLGHFAQAQRRFHENPGIKSKLDTLAERFGIATEHADWICQLYRLRNAITHNFRTIGGKQLDQAGELVVRWDALEMFVEGTQTQTRTPMRGLLGKPLPEASKIITQRVVREHRFNAGDQVHLDRIQLEEICLFFHMWCIPSVRDAFIAFMKARRGVQRPKAAEACIAPLCEGASGDMPSQCAHKKIRHANQCFSDAYAYLLCLGICITPRRMLSSQLLDQHGS
jgi:hypothetical protein